MPTRLKLNVFSPLPPLHTGIANHTSYLLPWLGQMADVTVWTAQREWTAVKADGVVVRTHRVDDLPWERLNEADATFFNIGNNVKFHKEIFQVASVLPGVCILHDTVLQHFFAGLAVGHEWQQEYLTAMRRHHGPDAAGHAQRFLSGEIRAEEMSRHYPLSLAAAERSIAVLCHNAADVEALKQKIRILLYHCELPMDIGGIEAPVNRKFVPPYRILVFGFLGPNRRVSSLLQALAALPGRNAFRLHIYGDIDDEREVWRLISTLHLDSLVQVHGFVESSVLEHALADAHLAINLRNPSMGEASASQLRIWAHALPSIVTRTGWYATLPPEAVFFVDPDDEVEGIGHHLVRFLASPATYEAAGQYGRRIVATRHSPQKYAETLMQIARDASVQHERRAAIDLARASSRSLMFMAGIDATTRATPGVADKIAQLICSPVSGASRP